jgi:hypothetical protein
MMDAATHVALACHANFVSMSIHALVKCLTENGALKPGLVERVLQSTLDNAGSERSRLDYVLLQELLNRLEKNEPTTH